MSTSSTGWTEVHEDYTNGTSNDTNLALYYKVMGASPDTSFVAVGPTGNNNGTIGVAFAFRGIDPAVLDIAFVAASHSAGGTATTNPNPPSITPSSAGAWVAVVGAGAAAVGGAYSTPSDLSSTTNHFRSGNHAETIDIALGLGIKTDWSSGAFDPAAWTGGVSNAGDSWRAFVIALKPALTGSLSVTLEALTSSSAATLALAASASPTFEALTSSAAGVLPLVASASPTLEALSLSSASALAIAGLAAATLSDVTLSSASSLPIQGASSVTLDGIALSASGSLSGSSPITGSLAVTLGALSLSASGAISGWGGSDPEGVVWSAINPTACSWSGASATPVSWSSVTSTSVVWS